MATKIQELVAQFGARLNQFSRGVGTAIALTQRLKASSNAAFASIRNTANQAGADVAKAFGSIERTATKAGLLIGGSMTAATAATATLGFSFIKTKDNALLAFETMLGSAEAAQRFYKSLEAFEAATPFEMPGLLKAAQRLLSTKQIAEDQVIPVMRSLGDAVALVGGDNQNIDRATVAVAQMAAKMKFSFQEMNQLAENQVFGWEALAQVLGVSVPKAMEMVEKDGAGVFKHFNEFLLQIGKNADGAMQKQSRMLSGLLSTVSSSASRTAGDIFEPMYRAATKFLAWAMGPTGFEMKGVTEGLKETVAGISKDVFTWLQINGQAALDRLGQAFMTFGNGVRGVISYLTQNGSAIGNAARGIVDWVLAIGRWMAEHPRLMVALVAMKLAFATGIPQAIGGTVASLAGLALHLAQIGLLFRMVFGTTLGQALMANTVQLLRFVSTLKLIQNFRLGGLVASLAECVTKISAASLGLAGLKIAVTALVVYSAYKLSQWAWQFAIAAGNMADVRKEMERSVRLANELFAIRMRILGMQIQDAMAMPDRDAAAKALKQMMDDAVSRHETVLTQWRKHIEALHEAEHRWWEAFVPAWARGIVDAWQRKQSYENPETLALRKKLDEAKEEIEKLREAIVNFNHRGRQEGQGGGAPGGPGGGTPATTPDDTEPATPPKLTPEEKREERIRQHGYKEEEKKAESEANFPALKGFSDAMKFAESGASLDELEQWLGDLEGMDQDFLSRLMDNLKEEVDWLQKQLEERLKDLQGQLDRGELTPEQHAAAVESAKQEIPRLVREETEKAVREGVAAANKNRETSERSKERKPNLGAILDESDLTWQEGSFTFWEQPSMKAALTDFLEIQRAFEELEIDEEAYKEAVDAIRKKVREAAERARKIAKSEKDIAALVPKGEELAPEWKDRQKHINDRFKEDSPFYTEDDWNRDNKDLQERIQAEQDAEREIGDRKKEGPVDPNLMAEYEEILGKLKTFQMTAGEFKIAMDRLDEKFKASADGAAGLARIMDGPFGKMFPKGSAGAAQLEKAYRQLHDRMVTGKLKIADFNKEMKKLEEQAEKAAEAERQQRIINGNFVGAGLDPMQALRDELEGRQMTRFGDMISQWADRITGAAGQAQQFGQDLYDAGGMVADFAANLPGGGDVGQVWSTISNFLASLEGQRQAALAQIQLLRQSLQITEDALSRQDLQRKIDELIAQLAEIEQQQANLPTFVADRGELDFRDPALSGGDSGSSRSGSVTITFPNVNRFGQAEAAMMAEAIERERIRRGNRQ